MSDNSEILKQFTSITGVNEERARFFLDTYAWKLDVALAGFYENTEDDLGEVSDSLPQVENNLESSPTLVRKPKKKPHTASSNIATLSSLTNSSDDEDEGQAFYAGGSEHSGQQVLGPPKKKDSIVSGMFKSVKEHGVEILDEDVAGTSSSKAFRGTGYKLGQNSDDTVTVDEAGALPEPPQITLKLWRDGFSLNDGDLRLYSDSSNRNFLKSIQRGEIPQELRQGSSEVHLAMEDHRMDTYRQNENKKRRPFTGQGYTLGSPAPPVVGSTGEEDKPLNEAKAKKALNLDHSQPFTSLQIRLSDGSRLIAQFNHTHTVANVRSYIISARPQYATREFNLLSSYPSKILDDSQTLLEAGLLNSAIMQKLY